MSSARDKPTQLHHELLSPFPLFTAEDINTRAIGDAPNHIVKLVRLTGMFAARRLQAGEKLFDVVEFRAMVPGIHKEFAVVLR